MTAVIDLQAARGRRGGSASAAAIARADRERKAIALRQQGRSFDEIASELDYADRSGARKAVERGLSRWMRETDEELRARELERTELMIDRLWPLVDCEAPDLKAMDRLLKTMDHRAKITGLYGKRAAPPDTYAGAPNPGESGKTHMVNRYIELVDQMMVGVIEAGYGSGIPRPGDDDEDDLAATARPPTSDIADVDDDGRDHEIDDGGALPNGYVRVNGRRARGKWVDDKFVPAADEVNDVESFGHHQPGLTTSEHAGSAPLRAQALDINSDA